MSRKLNYYLAFLIICPFMLLMSCSNGDDTLGKEDLNLKEIVSSENGILVFNDKLSIEQTILDIGTLNDKELIEWENSLQFKSLKRILYESNEADYAMYASYLKKGFSRDEIIGMKKEGLIPMHSELTNEYLEKEILIHNYLEDGSRVLDLKLDVPFMLRFLNCDGMVCIADTIYQYTNTAVKKMIKPDFSKIEQLKRATSSSSKDNIIVAFLQQSKHQLKSEFDQTKKITEGSDYNCQSWGCQKLYASLNLRKYIEYDPFYQTYYGTINYFLSFKTYTYRWGDWRRDDQTVSGNGNYDWSFDVYVNGSYQSGYGSSSTYYFSQRRDNYIIRSEQFDVYSIGGSYVDEEIWTFDDGNCYQYLHDKDNVAFTMFHDYPVDSESF